MAISRINFGGLDNGAGAASVSTGTIVSLQNGDALFVSVSARMQGSALTITPAQSGWTSVIATENSGTTLKHELFKRVWATGGNTNYAFNLSVSRRAATTWIIVRGHNNAQTTEIGATTDANGVNTYLSRTPGTSADMHIITGCIAQVPAQSPAIVGYNNTLIWSSGGGSNSSKIGAYQGDFVLPSSSPTSEAQAGWGISADCIAHSFIVYAETNKAIPPGLITQRRIVFPARKVYI